MMGVRAVARNFQQLTQKGQPFATEAPPPTSFLAQGVEYRVTGHAGEWFPQPITVVKRDGTETVIHFKHPALHTTFDATEVFDASRGLRQQAGETRVSCPLNLVPTVEQKIPEGLLAGTDVVFDAKLDNPLLVNHVSLLLGENETGEARGRLFFSFAFMIQGELFQVGQVGNSAACWLEDDLFVTKSEIENESTTPFVLNDRTTRLTDPCDVGEVGVLRTPLLWGGYVSSYC